MDDDIRETTQAMGNALALMRRLLSSYPEDHLLSEAETFTTAAFAQLTQWVHPPCQPPETAGASASVKTKR
jgi:hypothetical protein